MLKDLFHCYYLVYPELECLLKPFKRNIRLLRSPQMHANNTVPRYHRTFPFMVIYIQFNEADPSTPARLRH